MAKVSEGTGGRSARDGRPRGRPKPRDSYDVLVVGGGPAGLSAALVLGRCRRRVIVVDSGRPRNAAALRSHGYLTRDGIGPHELLRLGREEVARYGVEVLDDEVVDARCPSPDGSPGPGAAAFEAETRSGRRLRSRKLLLATGVRDVLPPVEGAERYYGRGVHHCPYCDAWEHRDARLAAYGAGGAAVGLALSLRTWSDRVTACTDGRPVDAGDRARLRRNGIALRTEPVARLDGDDEALGAIVFEGGRSIRCDALFFNTGQVQRSTLPGMLGCEYREEGQVETHGKQHTCTPGLFMAGDADGDVQFLIVAAAEGARAATAINRELQDEDRGEAGVRPNTSSRARAPR
ncbi:NAD(P)/FAD-dependent oxidoreductase [Tautonia plasticadhaerens]|uniref:NADH dehydrogenase n=1 Tax=Tautonia plasticadhaerens TaxID=2527974 RepID=A0A518HFF1_9BACT|nr:NAD(P)/FAD-dependent oxidoreductase [Tautonia plasticadhaerens]QDV39579.1 NADH dehydrogenase [Tautonia plasticadhaerens]